MLVLYFYKLLSSRNMAVTKSSSDLKSLNLEEDLEFLKPNHENKLDLSNPEELSDSSNSSTSNIPTFSDKSHSVDSGLLRMDNSFDFSSLANLSAAQHLCALTWRSQRLMWRSVLTVIDWF